MSLLKGIGKKLKPKKRAVLKNDAHVYKDWIYSLGMFFLLVILAAMFGAYMFLGAENIEVYEDSDIQDPSKDVIDQELLLDTIEFYVGKEERFKELKNNFSGAPRI